VPDNAAVPGPARVTWWGHGTVALTDSGTTVLTDPVLTDRVAHLHRRRGSAPPASAARVDGVVISHLHADHLHVGSLRRIPFDVPVVLPLGAARRVRGLARTGHHLVEVSPGDEVTLGALTVHVVPAVHDGRRLPRGRQDCPALGFVVQGRRRTYFAGDTALTDDMAGWAPGCDLALLPVGGWGPSLGPGHMDPARAAEAAALLRPRLAVPVHFGTLWPRGCGRLHPEMFAPPGAEFVRRAAERGVRAVELAPGGSLVLDEVLG
jgi:L-ascorbate metabolism protein UlaG (beta-lactamase superfamily)